MTMHLGNVPAGITLYIPFTTYGKTNGESITLTGLAVTDIEIYKNGSVTQRASDAGYTLLDTDGIDFDGITGLHGFSVDLNDNTDAGFYSVGGFYWVVVSAVTVDSQTVNFVAATFRIVAAEAVTGKPKVDVDAWLGTAAATPTVAGVPEVDVTHVGGTAQTAGDLAALLATLTAYVDTEVAAILAAVDTEVAAIKAKTDSLPTDPADASDIAASFASIASTLSTIAAYVDTEVAAIKAKTDQLTFTTANKVDSRVDNVAGTAQTAGDIAALLATLTAYVDTEVAAILAAVDTEVAAIKAKTDNLPAAPAATSDIPTAAQNADALLGRNIAGGSSTGRTVTSALRKLRNRVAIVAGTMTVYQEDDSTADHTAAVTTAAGDPISSVDPA